MQIMPSLINQNVLIPLFCDHKLEIKIIDINYVTQVMYKYHW